MDVDDGISVILCLLNKCLLPKAEASENGELGPLGIILKGLEVSTPY